MPFKSGTVDEHAVKAAGGEVLPGGAGVQVGGWTVTSRRGPIAKDAEMDALKAELGAKAMPEQCYTANHLCLTHDASGASISFTAEDGLRGWLGDCSERVRVSTADEWMQARRSEVEAHEAKTMEYDWTFTTSYRGTVSSGGSSADGGGDSDGSGGAVWQETAEQMDRALLTSREPILYFDDVPLYESELEDHGMSQLSVKVRVMPRCWYVLMRFFLRVDTVLVRLREVRLFCRFDQTTAGGAAGEERDAIVVLREVRHHQGTFVELAAGGAPGPQGLAYADAEGAATALMAVAPVGVKTYVVERTRL